MKAMLVLAAPTMVFSFTITGGGRVIISSCDKIEESIKIV